MYKRTALVILLLGGLIAGCSSDNTLAPFEPEIVTQADTFQFQITDATDVTTTETYSWKNPASKAVIDHSTSLTGGSASVVIRDAAGVAVYSSDLKASGTEESQAGQTGTWTVALSFTDFDGSANIRVESK